MNVGEALLLATNVLVAAVALAAAVRRRWVLLAAAVVCCGVAGYAWFEARDWAAIVLGLAGVLVTATGVCLLGLMRAAERGMRGALREFRRRASGLTGELAELRAESAANEARTEEAKKLYKVTRDLGEVVSVSEMVEEFGKCLRSLFSLKTAYLVVLDRDDPQRAYLTHDLLSGEKENDKEKPVRLLRSRGLSPDYFGVKEGGELEAAAVPLRFRGRVEAVVVLEGERLSDARRTAAERIPVLGPLAGQLNMAYNRCMLHWEVVRMSQTDALTEVLKKGWFLERAREELERVRGKDVPTTFIMFDIDHFKDYNDTYGHLVGDVVLRHVAGFLRRNVRRHDVVGRYGGEEFLVVLVETPKEGGRVAAERTRRAVEEFRFPVEEKETGITISAGLATCPGDGTELDEVVTKADGALYRAKQAGRNRVCAAGE